MIGWTVACVIWLTGMYLASAAYPQLAAWDIESKIGKVALVAAIILWPVCELYSLVADIIQGNDEEEKGE